MTIDKTALKALAASAMSGGVAENDALRKACRATVIWDLIEESEQLVAQLCVCPSCHGQGEIYTGSNTWEGHFQPPEPIMEKCGECDGDGVIGDAEDLKSLMAERGQLKAENESLRNDAERNNHMLLSAAITIGEICEALGIDSHSEPDMIVEAVRELKSESEALLESNDKLSRRNGMLEQNAQVMTEAHVLYTWLRKKADQPGHGVVAVTINTGPDWIVSHDLDKDLRALIDAEEP